MPAVVLCAAELVTNLTGTAVIHGLEHLEDEFHLSELGSLSPVH